MIKLREVRQLSLFKRRVILFVVLFVLAVPMAVLIGNTLAGRIAKFNGTPLFERFEMNEGLGESFLQVQETGEELREHIANMPDMATTSSSTVDIAITSQE